MRRYNKEVIYGLYNDEEVLLRAVRKAKSKHLEIFDVYTGIGIGLDKKSMAYSLTFSDNKKTLTDEEVNSSMEKIIDTVSKKCALN